MPDREYT